MATILAVISCERRRWAALELRQLFAHAAQPLAAVVDYEASDVVLVAMERVLGRTFEVGRAHPCEER
jgi:hypothetical protein